MDSVRSLLPGVLRKRGLHTVATSSLVAHLAERWLEETLSNVRSDVSVRSYKDTVLTIECSHSIALQECRQVLGELRAFLAKECPDAVIQDIRLQRDEKR